MKKRWFKNGRRIIVDGKQPLCEDCPCGKQYLVDPVENCGCYKEDGLYIGKLTGTYRIIYIAGAVRTNADELWNERKPSKNPRCLNTLPGWAMYCNSRMLTNFVSGTGYQTAEEAETASAGTYTYISFYYEDVYLWYNDDGCDDNEGAIIYEIKRIS